MAKFEIIGPDGKKYVVEGATAEGALAALKRTIPAPAAAPVAAPTAMDGPMPPPPAEFASLPGSNIAKPSYRGLIAGADQLSSGTNEGLANFAGMPVDLMTAGLNLGATGINSAFGTEIPAIENPVGGSGTFKAMLDPVISDTAPETASQRYLRRIGQEVGFGVPAAMTGAAIPGYGAPAREAMGPYLAASVAGDVGAGTAGQTAREVAPKSSMLDLLASMIGGGGLSYAASRFTPSMASVPTLDSLKSKANSAWQAVKAAPETLTDSATAGLAANVKGALPDGQLAAEAYPKAYGMADKMDTLRNPTVYDVEQARRMVGDRVAASPDESRVGVEMKRSIEEYLAGLKPADLQGGSVDDTLDALSTARRTTHQVKKAEAITNAEMRADTRAATTGTGGNQVNANRQNIRAIYDRERDLTKSGRRSGYTPDEMAAMARVVHGTPGSNVARALGRMAPSSGALPMAMMGYGGAGGVGMAGLTGNPVLALPAIAGGVGEISKALAGKMTQKQIDSLMATILNGGRVPGQSASRLASARAILEQMLSNAASAPQ